MSLESTQSATNELKARFGTDPVELDLLMREYVPFKPTPKSPTAITRHLKALYAAVQRAVLEKKLTIEAEHPSEFNLLQAKGVAEFHNGALPKRSTTDTFVNYRIYLDEKFEAFVRGELRSLPGFGSPLRQGKQRKKSQWDRVKSGVDTLRGNGDKQVEAFVALFDEVNSERKRPGRPPSAAKE